MKWLVRLCLVILVCTGSTPVGFAMSSTNYQINWDNINAGGNELGTSANFLMQDTVGDTSAGALGSSASYQEQGGYRAGIVELTISFVVEAQSTDSSAYTAFSRILSTVDVTTPATFEAGDFIAVIENAGFAQKVAVGRILTIVGSTVTVDSWSGDGLSMSASPSGGDDFVRILSSTSVALGTVTRGGENVDTLMTSVLSDAPYGYSIYLHGAQELNDSLGHTMTPVTDGVVSTGSEEYGAATKGASAVSADVDIGVTTTQRVVQTNSVPTGSTPDRVAMVYKLSVVDATVAGAYTQDVYYTMTANY